MADELEIDVATEFGKAEASIERSAEGGRSIGENDHKNGQ